MAEKPRVSATSLASLRGYLASTHRMASHGVYCPSRVMREFLLGADLYVTRKGRREAVEFKNAGGGVWIARITEKEPTDG